MINHNYDDEVKPGNAFVDWTMSYTMTGFFFEHILKGSVAVQLFSIINITRDIVVCKCRALIAVRY